VESLYRAVDDRHTPSPSGKGRGPRDPGGAGQSGSTPSATPSQNTSEIGRPTGNPGRRAARVLALGSAAHADLVPSTATQDAPESEAEQAQLWSERIVRAHAGDGAHSMWRSLLADLPKTRTPWEQVLRTQLARGLSHEPELSWSRPSRSYLANQGSMGPHRRMPFEPGSSPNRAVPRLVLVVDVSGSIDDALMQRFACEIEAISRRLSAGVTLIVGDDQVRRIERFAPGRCDLSEIEFKGGGGTDFGPLLEEAARHQPDITVVLTDLDGPAHYRPRCPVIWAVPPAYAGAVLPFGRKLVLS
jgi:predicted metal-dependent peptidase